MPSFAAKPLTLETMFPLADDALHHLSISLSSPELKSCILNAVGSFLILENIPDLDCRKEAAATIVNRWLSFRRTPNDVHEMLSMSCKCSSPQTTDAIHVVGAGMAERNLTPGALLLGGFTRKLRKMLEETSDYNKSKIHHLSSRTSWPHNTGQLLPHGPDQTILGFLDWSTAPDARSAQLLMQALNSVMHYTWPLVLPIIVNNHLFLEQFIGAASYWFNKVNTLPWTKSQALHDTYAIHVISALLQLSAIMHLICLDFSDPTSTKHFLGPWHDDVLPACDHILSTAALISQHVLTKEASDIQNDIVAQIKPIGVAIYTDFPACRMRSPQLAALGVSIDVIHYLNSKPATGPWWKLIKVLQLHYMRQQCAAPGCGITTEQHGRHFRFCSGCFRVRYCSRACQKGAWRRDDGLQHRDVCPLIRYICLRHRLPHSMTVKTMSSDMVPNLAGQELLAVVEINKRFEALTLHGLRS